MRKKLEYAEHLTNGWGCKANIIEALKIICNVLELGSDRPEIIRKAKAMIFSMLFFKIIIYTKHKSEAILCVNYGDSSTSSRQMSAEYEKLLEITSVLNQFDCLSYNEHDLNTLYEQGEQSAGTLLAQIYLAGSFTNAFDDRIKSTPENLAKAVTILKGILKVNTNNLVANLLYGIALKHGKGTQQLPFLAKTHLDKLDTELPVDTSSMLYENLKTWKLGKLSYPDLTKNRRITFQTLDEEIAQDIIENLAHLELRTEAAISLQRHYSQESFNNVLQVGVLLGIGDTAAVINKKAESTELSTRYHAIMQEGWDTLTQDGDRFLSLLKWPIFSEAFMNTVFTKTSPERVPTNPMKP